MWPACSSVWCVAGAAAGSPAADNLQSVGGGRPAAWQAVLPPTKLQAHTLWDWALNCGMLLSGWLPVSWRWAGALLARGGLPQGEVAQSVVWVLIQARACTAWLGLRSVSRRRRVRLPPPLPLQPSAPMLDAAAANAAHVLQAGAGLALGLPWSAYSTFVLEAAHGFNKTSWRTFALDRLKAALLGLALVPPLVAGLTAILVRASPFVGLYLWAFLLAVSLFMVSVERWAGLGGSGGFCGCWIVGWRTGRGACWGHGWGRPPCGAAHPRSRFPTPCPGISQDVKQNQIRTTSVPRRSPFTRWPSPLCSTPSSPWRRAACGEGVEAGRLAHDRCLLPAAAACRRCLPSLPAVCTSPGAACCRGQAARRRYPAASSHPPAALLFAHDAGRTSVERLAASVGFPLRKLFVIDGSRRSAHSNAYMVGLAAGQGAGGRLGAQLRRRRGACGCGMQRAASLTRAVVTHTCLPPRCSPPHTLQFGFGRNKRICLYDTLLDQCTEEQVGGGWQGRCAWRSGGPSQDELRWHRCAWLTVRCIGALCQVTALAPPCLCLGAQVVAVLAHELGHWAHSHLPKLLAAQQAASLAQLLLFTLVRAPAGGRHLQWQAVLARLLLLLAASVREQQANQPLLTPALPCRRSAPRLLPGGVHSPLHPEPHAMLPACRRRSAPRPPSIAPLASRPACSRRWAACCSSSCCWARWTRWAAEVVRAGVGPSTACASAGARRLAPPCAHPCSAPQVLSPAHPPGLRPAPALAGRPMPCPPPAARPPPQVLSLATNVVSRRFEFQADAYGAARGSARALAAALKALDKENKVGAGWGGVGWGRLGRRGLFGWYGGPGRRPQGASQGRQGGRGVRCAALRCAVLCWRAAGAGGEAVVLQLCRVENALTRPPKLPPRRARSPWTPCTPPATTRTRPCWSAWPRWTPRPRRRRERRRGGGRTAVLLCRPWAVRPCDPISTHTALPITAYPFAMAKRLCYWMLPAPSSPALQSVRAPACPELAGQRLAAARRAGLQQRRAAHRLSRCSAVCQVGENRNTVRPVEQSSGSPRAGPQAVAPTVMPASPRLMAAPVRAQYRDSRVDRSQEVATASPPAQKAGW